MREKSNLPPGFSPQTNHHLLFFERGVIPGTLHLHCVCKRQGLAQDKNIMNLAEVPIQISTGSAVAKLAIITR